MTATRIFGCRHPFVGRERELERLVAAAHAGDGVTVLAAPGVGASELLKQAFDELFSSESVVPFYFELRPSDRDIVETARRFAREFLTHAVAFGRHDPRIIRMRPTPEELAYLAPPGDADWMEAAIHSLTSSSVDPANLFALPARSSAKVAVFIDNVHRVRLIRNGGMFLESIAGLAASGVAVIASGLRRALYGRLPFEQLKLEPPGPSGAAQVVAAFADHRTIQITDPVRDFIAVQMESSVKDIELLFAQAADDGEALTDFKAVARVYTNSTFGGHVARCFRRRVLRAVPRIAAQNDVVRLLAETLASEEKRLAVHHWRRDMHNVDDAAFGRLILHLHVEEVISAGDGFVDMSVTSRIVSDYVDARSRILSAPEKRAAIVGQTMQLNLARAPRLMSEFYRSNAAIGVRRLLDGLRGQTVPRAAIDYRPFKTNHKGQEDAATLSALRSATDTIDLPYVVYTANAAAFYPPLREIGDRDRSAIGLTETGEAWIVAEIDSKLEADAALTEFWCDRLEMAAVNCGLDRFRIWLIAPEGFADESLDILDTRRAYGSSKKQIEFLGQVLSSPREPEPDEQTSYEIVVPMGDEGEIVATRTLADVAARHGIPDKTLAQCKTALIEAMINAGEHSLSPDRRIELGFVVTGQALTIVITNRGLRLTDRMPSGEVLDEARRGWGLQLMQKLMDDVRVEPTDDGTRLVMTKHFRNNDVDAVL